MASVPHAHASYIGELDGIRAVAILAVMLYHLWIPTSESTVAQAISQCAQKGWCGVDLFFSLSGFLITGILIDSRRSSGYWRNFYIRRALRIFPLYYLVTTLLVVAAAIVAVAGWHVPALEPAVMWNVWANYLYLTNITITMYGHDWAPLSISWSLAMEEQYYLVFPFVVWLLRPRYLVFALLGVVFAAPILRWLLFDWSGGNSVVPYTFPLCRMDGLALGGLATLIVRSPSVGWRRGVTVAFPCLLVAAIAFLALFERVQIPYVVLGYTLPAAATASLIVALRSGCFVNLASLLRVGALTFVGRISYGLYLYHLLVNAPVKWAFDWLEPRRFAPALAVDLLQMGIVVLLSVVVAWLSWVYFERPILAWKDRLAPKDDQVAPNEAAPSPTVAG